MRLEKAFCIFRTIVTSPIVVYRWVFRPFVGSCCRFEPSCSSYAIEAIKKRGVFVGLFLMTLRLLRCHPWSQGGYDPVLPKRKEKS